MGHQVVGIDNVNDYYDIDLKKSRNESLKKLDNFEFYILDLKDKAISRTMSSSRSSY